MQKKIQLLFGTTISIACVFLGFHILITKDNSTLTKIIGYSNIIFFGFWSLIGILVFFGNSYIPQKMEMLKTKKKYLRILGIIFSIIVVLVFLNFIFDNFISGWNNPK